MSQEITKKIVSMFSGISGGMINWFYVKSPMLDFLFTWDFAAKFVEAGCTAFFCGFMGVLGKEIFDRIKGMRKKKTIYKPKK